MSNSVYARDTLRDCDLSAAGLNAPVISFRRKPTARTADLLCSSVVQCRIDCRNPENYKSPESTIGNEHAYFRPRAEAEEMYFLRTYPIANDSFEFRCICRAQSPEMEFKRQLPSLLTSAPFQTSDHGPGIQCANLSLNVGNSFHRSL